MISADRNALRFLLIFTIIIFYVLEAYSIILPSVCACSFGETLVLNYLGIIFNEKYNLYEFRSFIHLFIYFRQLEYIQVLPVAELHFCFGSRSLSPCDWNDGKFKSFADVDINRGPTQPSLPSVWAQRLVQRRTHELRNQPEPASSTWDPKNTAPDQQHCSCDRKKTVSLIIKQKIEERW